MSDIPFGITDWSAVEPTTHAGQPGTATWRTRQFGDLRVRLVEYSPGYCADHWCTKGHILLCLSGELEKALAVPAKDGFAVVPTPAAESLVGYLLSLKRDDSLPKAINPAPAKAPEAKPAAAPKG